MWCGGGKRRVVLGGCGVGSDQTCLNDRKRPFSGENILPVMGCGSSMGRGASMGGFF